MIVNCKNSNLSDNIDFIGIGVGKSGSTWVAECLRAHPEILFAEEKEITFFNEEKMFTQHLPGKSIQKYNRRYNNGIEWYIDQFPKYEFGKIRGEFSIDYLFDKKAPQRIQLHFPNVKLLVTLRNPREMLYSLYQHFQTTIRYSVKEEFSTLIQNDNFLSVGLYHKQLKRYYELFPVENIHVILLDDIKNNPKNVVKKLFHFLNVSEDYYSSSMNEKIGHDSLPKNQYIHGLCNNILKLVADITPCKIYDAISSNSTLYNLYSRINMIKRSDKYHLMQSIEVEYLKNYYKDDIENLSKLIQRDLSAWYI